MDSINSGESNPDYHVSEYPNQLRNWLGQAYLYYEWYACQCISLLPLPVPMSHQMLHSNYTTTQEIDRLSVPGQPQQGFQQPRGINDNNLPPNIIHNNVAPQQQQAGRILEIPRLSKRLLAELIDFGLLFLVKALITLTFLDSWNLDLLENEGTAEDDYEIAMALTANLLTIEFIHRVLVVVYEVWFTHTQGGTPGKRTMGIRILYCTKCLPIGENRVLVFPATELNVWRSIGRAFLKNMGTALLFPTFLPLMMVQHNRTLYDVFCGTIVVESD